MSWIIDAFELGAGSGEWHWSATPLLSESSPAWREWTRTWLSVRSFKSQKEARAAASGALARIATPNGEDSGQLFPWSPDALASPSTPAGALARSVEAYTLDRIDGESVMVTAALPVVCEGARWAGNSVYSRDYVLSLVQCSLEAGLITTADLLTPAIRSVAMPQEAVSLPAKARRAA